MKTRTDIIKYLVIGLIILTIIDYILTYLTVTYLGYVEFNPYMRFMFASIGMIPTMVLMTVLFSASLYFSYLLFKFLSKGFTYNFVTYPVFLSFLFMFVYYSVVLIDLTKMVIVDSVL